MWNPYLNNYACLKSCVRQSNNSRNSSYLFPLLHITCHHLGTGAEVNSSQLLCNHKYHKCNHKKIE